MEKVEKLEEGELVGLYEAGKVGVVELREVGEVDLGLLDGEGMKLAGSIFGAGRGEAVMEGVPLEEVEAIEQRERVWR